MRIHSYIVKHDNGFSPNPFHGFCTLACCKPIIRRCSEVGDWVVGLSPKKHEYKLIYAMKVEEKLSFHEYWNSERFQVKKVDLFSPKGKAGDNIYEQLYNGTWKQHPSFHTMPPFTEQENEKTKNKDIGGKNVLVSQTFVYFGRAAIQLPPNLTAFLPAGRGHKSNFSPDNINKWNHFISDILSKQRGLIANPHSLPKNNENNIQPKRC